MKIVVDRLSFWLPVFFISGELSHAVDKNNIQIHRQRKTNCKCG